MGAIGGVINFDGKEIDFSLLNNMRRSMALRGRKGSAAFINSGVGMFFCASSDASSDDERQPSIHQRRGKSVAVCVDSDGIEPKSVCEKYFVYGTDFLGCIDGAFALSLYDEEREIIILARGKNAKKPLFYRMIGNKIVFSSEPKGVISASLGAIDVNRHILEYHITAPMGVYRAADIYSDISEVLAGECVIFTRFGISKFFFRKNRESDRVCAKKSVSFTKEKIVYCYQSNNFDNVSEYLGEALLAFDYPQFDCFMPSLLDLLKKVRSQGKDSIIFEDMIRRRNLLYAREREDRLSSLCGVRAIGAFTRNVPMFDEKDNDRLEDRLHERFFAIPPYDRLFLREVFGEYKLELLLRVLEKRAKKEDTEKRIRILGMLCQTVDLMQSRDVRLVDRNREYSAYYV